MRIEAAEVNLGGLDRAVAQRTAYHFYRDVLVKGGGGPGVTEGVGGDVDGEA